MLEMSLQVGEADLLDNVSRPLSLFLLLFAVGLLTLPVFGEEEESKSVSLKDFKG